MPCAVVRDLVEVHHYESMAVGDEVVIDITGRAPYRVIRASVRRFNHHNPDRELTVHKPRCENYSIVERIR